MASGSGNGPVEYSPEERALLLNLAHRAIQAKIDHQPLETNALTEHLSALRGAFTTLHMDGELRGCVGYVIPMYSLYRTVAETAVAAAFSDPRFSPVTAEEAGKLIIEISVLSSMSPIEPEQVEVGKHGLLVSMGDRRGLLLPQVPVEHGWNRVTFLEQTCYKAGLPPLAWKQGAKLEAFTAEIFGEF